MSALGILSQVPWGKIISYGPPIIETAGALLDSVRNRFGKKAGSSVGGSEAAPTLNEILDRVSALEANEVRQAELVSKIAEQLGSLSSALEVLSKRVALAFFLSLGALVASLIAVIVALSR
jgi:hypothetical protein